jgi:hypothetical protein
MCRLQGNMELAYLSHGMLDAKSMTVFA